MALEEFNKIAHQAFSNASAYQTAFANNEAIGSIKSLNATGSIAGSSSTSNLSWNYQDTQVNKYDKLNAFIESGFDIYSMAEAGLDPASNISFEAGLKELNEEWTSLFGTDLNLSALKAGTSKDRQEEFLKQFMGGYDTSEA